MISAIKEFLDFEAYYFKLIYCKIKSGWRSSTLDDALDTIIQAIPIINFLDSILVSVKLRKEIRKE